MLLDATIVYRRCFEGGVICFLGAAHRLIDRLVVRQIVHDQKMQGSAHAPTNIDGPRSDTALLLTRSSRFDFFEPRHQDLLDSISILPFAPLCVLS